MDNNLTKKVLSSIRKERVLINKIVLSNERDDNLSFAALQEMYKEQFINTNSLVDDIADNIDLKSLKKMAMEDNRNIEESFDKFTLVKLVNYKILDKIRNNITTSVDNSVFDEEHYKYLYSVYMWYVKNHDLSENLKKSLHNFLLLKAVGSNTLRNFFAGNYDKIDELSDPSVKYENIPNEIIEECYYLSFNNLLRDLDTSEAYTMYFKDKSLFNSNKLFASLQFTAMSTQMSHKNIIITGTEKPISNYAREVLQDASELASDYAKIKEKSKIKVISL